MKNKYYYLTLKVLIFSCFITNVALSQGIYYSAMILKFNNGSETYYVGSGNSGSQYNIDGTDIGTFQCNSNVKLVGAEIQTYKDCGQNVTGTRMYYKIYKDGDTPGGYTALNTPFNTDLTTDNCNGSTVGHNQKWKEGGVSIDLISGLTNGKYWIEVYFEGSGNPTSTFFHSNNGANYKATFTINNPTAPIISGTTNICNGESSSLTASCNTGGFVKWTDGTFPNPRTVSPTTTTSYTATCILGDGTCESSVSANYTVNVNNVSIITQPASQTDCALNDIVLSVDATGIGTLNYLWQQDVGGGFTNLTDGGAVSQATTHSLKMNPLTGLHLSKYKCVVTDANGCSVTSNEATISVNSLPASLASQVICVGDNVTFSISPITGTPTSFQWQRRGNQAGDTFVNITNGSGFSGATTSLLTLTAPSIATQSGTFYKCTVIFPITAGNDNGPNATECIITSDEGQLTINPLPNAPTLITPSPPTTTVEKCLGESVTLTSTGCLSGGTKWYEGTTVLSNTASYSFTPIAVGTKQYYSTCTESSSGKSCEGPKSATITVNINPVPIAPPVTINPVSAIVCQGGTVVLAATLTGTRIRWYKQAVGGANQASNNTTVNRIIPVAEVIPTDPNTPRVVSYWTEQENSFGCISTRTQTSFTVNPNTIITTSPVSQTICETSPVTFTVAATGLNLSYQWKKGSTNVGTNSNTFDIPSVTTSDAGSYSCVVTGTCVTATSTAATLTVNLLTNITTHPQAQTVCEGTANITFSVSAVGTSLSYQWKKGTTNVGTNAATYIIPAVVSGDAGNYTCVITGACGTQISNVAALVVNVVPTVPTVTTPINYCQNATTVALSASASNTILWYGTNSTGGISSTSVPTPSSAVIGTTTYYVSQKSADNCESPRVSIDVTVNAIPIAPTTNTTVNYCKDATATALSAIATGSNTLIWYDADDNILGSAPTPSTGIVGTQTFKVSQKTPLPANCEGPKSVITVNVFDNPVAPTVTPLIGYCQNATATALSATATSPNSLLWYGTAATGGVSSNSAPTPLTNPAVTTSYYVSQKDGNNCESPRAKIDVEVTLTLTAGTITGINAFCITGVLNNSTTLTANPTGGNGTYTYQWQNLTGNIVSASNQTYVTSTANTYKAIITSGYCTATTATFAITAQGWNDVPDVTGNALDICGSGSKTLSIVSPSNSGTYKWFADATTLSQISSGTSYSTPSLLTTTSYYVAREQAVTGSLTCQTNRTEVSINVVAIPPTPTIVNSANKTILCNNDTDFTLSVSCSSGSGYYRLNSGSWTAGNTVTISPPTYPSSATFTYDFKCVVSATCESSASSTSITINPKPNAPIITGNMEICDGQSTTLSVSNCTGTVIWTNSVSSSSINVSISGTYGAFCESNGCRSAASSSVNVVVNPIPATPTIDSDDADNTVCTGTNVLLTVSNCTGTVIWSNGKTTSSISITPIETTSYTATCTSTQCDILTIVTSEPLTIVVNSTPQPTNNTFDATFPEKLIFSAITNISNGRLMWYNDATGGIGSTTIPVFDTIGTYTRYVSQISDLGCESPRTQIRASIILSLKITQQPIFQANCDGSSVIFNVKAIGSETISYQWQRQKPNENVFSDILNETANNLRIGNIGNVENPHLSKYRCIIKDEKNTVVSVESVLIVNAIKGTLVNQSLCDGKPSIISFKGLTFTGKVAIYQWQKEVNNEFIDIPTNTDGTITISEPATYRGKITFFVDEKNTCIQNTDSLKIDIKPAPIAPQVVSQSICQNITFNLEKSISSTNTLLWYESDTDLIGDTIAPKLDFNKIGTNTFYVSQITQFGCESERKTFNITILPVPAKPYATDTTYCRNAPSQTLYAVTNNKNQLLWYDSQTSKIAFAKTPIPDTKTDGITKYFVSTKNTEGCESERVGVKVSVKPCIATLENNINSCLKVSADSIKGNKWYDLYDKSGHLYASVNPNGLNLGKVAISIRHYGRGSDVIPTTQNGNKLMARYIDFQSSLLKNFERPVSLRIYYQNIELDEYKTATNLPNLTINDFNIVHYDGIREDCGFENNDNFKLGNSVVIYKNVVGNQIADDFFFLQFDVNEFSENGATANDFTEITFTGNKTEEKIVKLNWQTKFEIKAEKFILERSTDCKKWTELGEIKANEVQSSYEQYDYQPLSGKNCYRLVYIDKDGTKKYLDPIEVDFTDTIPICTVFPNPWTAGESLNIYIRNIKEKEIKLYDMFGREHLINWKKDEKGIIKIMNTDEFFNTGTHFFVVIDEKGKRCLQKIVLNP